ncbi:MAG: hypothetical protein BM556_11475 [Bacteriovorax sp. MedPE-SWde]|nr:MAG: hypothetical protein BM556_11475 [Bacteriovorax sp. MedPE-SWde]
MRYYNSSTGRFVSEDPIGFLGGDPNLYGYVSNSPILYGDESGMGKICKRPISGSSDTSHSVISDYFNLEEVHEYISYEDSIGGSDGFYPDGKLFGKNGIWTGEDSDVDPVSCDDKDYDDEKLRLAVKKVKNDNKIYNLIPIFGDNCQSMMDKVRRQYEKNVPQ